MVKVLSDSTCDLSKELVERYGIDVIPLFIILGEREYKDGVNITPEEIYKWSDDNKTTPGTAAVSMADAMNVIGKYTKGGDDVVIFTISKSMSSTNNVFKLAADELEVTDKVAVIDSANLSTGIGLLVIEAAIMAKNGASLKEISDRMEELKPNVRASFVVDTLTYLHRGGRCSGVAALAGSLLSIHPKIEVVDGKMIPTKKYRGDINRVIMNYAKDMEADLKKARKERVFITHSGSDPKTVDEVRAYLEGLGQFDEILETRAGGVVSSHCGPGTLGVLFILS